MAKEEQLAIGVIPTALPTQILKANLGGKPK